MRPSKAIPEKLFFRIHEVAELVGVQAYVLRYWESRFPMLKPERMANDERRYRRREVQLLMRIRMLLHDEGFTIAGAVERIKRDPTGALDAEFDGMIPRSIRQTPEPHMQLDLLAQEYRDQASGVAQALDRLRELRRELIQLMEEQDGPATQ
ncbi:MerR family transcriptional regulator [bacterium]|nr:MerR family transcriptional regulator [bacterium]